MSERFLKLNLDNDESDFLALHHPNAFILLYFIAKRARRISGQADGLSIGQCYLGDFLSYGLTESEYRTAKAILCKRKIIKIIETCRTRKKSTTGMTTVGTLVELLDSRVWDIGKKHDDDRNDDRLTTGSRPVDDESREYKYSKNNSMYEEDKQEDYARPAAQPRSKDSLSFDFEKYQFVGITEKDFSEWKTLYPHIEIQAEILRASHWLKANPSKSKKTLWRKFLTGWLQRSNDKIENKKASQAAYGSLHFDKRTQDITGNPVSSPHTGRF